MKRRNCGNSTRFELSRILGTFDTSSFPALLSMFTRVSLDNLYAAVQRDQDTSRLRGASFSLNVSLDGPLKESYAG